jgi:4-hydroxybenzoyl-CoA reductase subunit alpha
MVKLNDDGTVGLLTLAIDIGQGSDTALPMIVAEELGVNMEDVKLIPTDTLAAPIELGTYAGRVTTMAGNACKAAASDAKRQLFEVVAEKLGLKAGQELEAKGRQIYIKGSPEKGMSFAEAALAAQIAKNGMPIVGRGVYAPRGGAHLDIAATVASSFGAQVAEVEVDRETGQVKVLKFTTAHDCGRAINPTGIEGQVGGGMHMGLGYGLSEELLMENGAILNPSFRDYKFLSAADMPEMETILVETNDSAGPFGAKEAGEGVVDAVAVAVTNAIHDATGVWVKDLPITPEKLLKALKEKDGGQ